MLTSDSKCVPYSRPESCVFTPRPSFDRTVSSRSKSFAKNMRPRLNFHAVNHLSCVSSNQLYMIVNNLSLSFITQILILFYLNTGPRCTCTSYVSNFRSNEEQIQNMADPPVGRRGHLQSLVHTYIHTYMHASVSYTHLTLPTKA